MRWPNSTLNQLPVDSKEAGNLKQNWWTEWGGAITFGKKTNIASDINYIQFANGQKTYKATSMVLVLNPGPWDPQHCVHIGVFMVK